MDISSGKIFFKKVKVIPEVNFNEEFNGDLHFNLEVDLHLFVESLPNFIIDIKVLLTTGIVDILYFSKILDNLVKFVTLYGKHTFG